MIKDDNTRNRLHAEWTGLLQIHARATSPDQSVHAGLFTKTPSDITLNLVMITAHKILSEVLLVLASQETFVCEERDPTSLLRASRDALPWAEFHLVNEGNQICERVLRYQHYVSGREASTYMTAIEQEFRRWQPFAPRAE